MPSKIRVGPHKKLEPGVRLGVAPVRPVADLSLALGRHAVLRSGTVIYRGSRIGDHLQTGHNAVIREENRIGDHFSLWTNSVVDYGCVIGDNVKIHCNCYVAQYTILEDDVFLAPGVVIANDFHPGSPDAKACLKGPTIKRGAQVGCNVTLLPGIILGEHCVVGAGSVVTRDVAPYTLVYGNPARGRKNISQVHCRIGDHFPYVEDRRGRHRK